MTATKIDGTAIAKSIREKLGAKIKERQAANPRYKPSLKIVQGETLTRRYQLVLRMRLTSSSGRPV
jgi:5,10-methylene-tetrahydrofolate dehydrogenase/methenyl tetrahydrofolate cyclohydrolase